MGLSKGDTRSLDHSSYRQLQKGTIVFFPATKAPRSKTKEVSTFWIMIEKDTASSSTLTKTFQFFY